MKNLNYIDENVKYPVNSGDYKRVVDKYMSEEDQNYVLCFDNLSTDNSWSKTFVGYLNEFVIPYLDEINKEDYEMLLDSVRDTYFNKVVSTIPGISIVSKNVAECTPTLSQICTGTLLKDSHGNVLVLVKYLEDKSQQFHLPQTHVEYTPDIYTDKLEAYICKKANVCLNECISITRKDDAIDQIELSGGYVVNTRKTLASAMHCMFIVEYVIDSFDNYDVRCVEEGQYAMILTEAEAKSASQMHMMDTWLEYMYSEQMTQPTE